MSWLMMEISWNRKEVSLGSPDLPDRCFPNVVRKTPELLIGPSDSTATGTKMCDLVISPYFITFFLAADSAAAPADRLISATGASQSVGCCDVPGYAFASLPRNKGATFRPFAV